MSNQPVTLGDAINQWMAHPDNLELASGTLTSKWRTYRALIRVVGSEDYLVDCLTLAHFEDTMKLLAEGLSFEENAQRRRRGLKAVTGRGRSALVADRSALTMLADYMRTHGWVAPNFFPLKKFTGTSKAPESKAKPKPGIKDEEVDLLLEVAGKHHPRTRFVVALGLYGGLRVSSALSIQWKHVDMAGPRISYLNVKRGIWVEDKAFYAPFKGELERWWKWYEGQVGPIDPDWYLIPGKVASTTLWQNKPLAYAVQEDPSLWPIAPNRAAVDKKITEDLHGALRGIGWGYEKIKGSGMHTLRRTVGRATDKVSGLAAAQVVLDHDDRGSTQVYTGNLAAKNAHEALVLSTDPYKQQPTPTPDPEPQQAPQGLPEGVVSLAAYRARRAG